MLSTRSFRSVRALCRRMRSAERRDDPQLAALAWSVGNASRIVPKATCLTQACALQIMLARRGIDAVLRIGVMNGAAFGAHAWLEHDGRVLVGGTTESLAQYARLATFGTPTP